MSSRRAGRNTDLEQLIEEGMGADRDRVCMMEVEFGTPRGLERYAREDFPKR